MASVTTADKSLLPCKTCGDTHERPVNNKYDRVKNMMEEKRDTSRENSEKDTT